jgi:hypothetical protein
LEIVSNSNGPGPYLLVCFAYPIDQAEKGGALLILQVRLLPVATLLTPATLNIRVGSSVNSTMMRVPMIDFKSLNFANIPGSVMDKEANFAYSNPQIFVQQVVTATTSAGQILNITAPFSNSSWNLDFYGPALSCGPAEAVLRQNIADQVLAATNPWYGDSTCGSGDLLNYGYLSWTPGSGHNASLPFDYSASNTTENYTLRSTTLGSVNSSLALFFMAISRMINTYDMYMCCLNTTCWQDYKDFVTNAPIIRCTAYNASYASRFNYLNGVQSVDIAVKEALNEVGFLSDVGLWIQPWDGTTFSVAFENYAYQAVIDAFGKMVVGSIRSDVNVGYDGKDTNIGATSLVNTKELGFLKALGSYTQQSTLQSFLPSTNLWNGTSVVPQIGDTIGLAQAIEEMFQNCTVSLMSSPMLQ